MSLNLDDVVRLDPNTEPVSRPVRRSGSSLLSSRITRRDLVKLAGVTGMAVGMTVLGWMPPMQRKACACHTTYTVWSDCAGISYSDCQHCCNSCGSDISSDYCCNNSGETGYKWHRHGQGGGVDYEIRTSSCDGRNAWIWQRNVCCGSPPRRNRRWRCSDGRYRICNPTCGAWNNSVCPYQLSNGTAC